jgi:hypothetical protein
MRPELEAVERVSVVGVASVMISHDSAGLTPDHDRDPQSFQRLDRMNGIETVVVSPSGESMPKALLSLLVALAAGDTAEISASVLAAGRCSFDDCLKHGWQAGDHTSRCNFGDCTTDGWTTSHPGGSQSVTRCDFGDCMKHGWTTRHPDGSESRARCGFGKCWEHGWTTRHADGSESSTRCDFDDCATKGWTTRLPDGKSVQCRCLFNDCRKHGADCG